MAVYNYALRYKWWTRSPIGKTHLIVDPHWPRTKCGVGVGHQATGWRVVKRKELRRPPGMKAGSEVDTSVDRCKRCYQ